jgi:hypothetical protein
MDGLLNHQRPHIYVEDRKCKRDERAEHIRRMGEMRNAYKILDGKPDRKRPFGRPRRLIHYNRP